MEIGTIVGWELSIEEICVLREIYRGYHQTPAIKLYSAESIVVSLVALGEPIPLDAAVAALRELATFGFVKEDEPNLYKLTSAGAAYSYTLWR